MFAGIPSVWRQFYVLEVGLTGSFLEAVCRSTFSWQTVFKIWRDHFLRMSAGIPSVWRLFYASEVGLEGWFLEDICRNTFSLKAVLCFGGWLGRLILSGCLQEYLQFEGCFMLWRLAWQAHFLRMSAGIPLFWSILELWSLAWKIHFRNMSAGICACCAYDYHESLNPLEMSWEALKIDSRKLDWSLPSSTANPSQLTWGIHDA